MWQLDGEDKANESFKQVTRLNLYLPHWPQRYFLCKTSPRKASHLHIPPLIIQEKQRCCFTHIFNKIFSQCAACHIIMCETICVAVQGAKLRFSRSHQVLQRVHHIERVCFWYLCSFALYFLIIFKVIWTWFPLHQVLSSVLGSLQLLFKISPTPGTLLKQNVLTLGVSCWQLQQKATDKNTTEK